MVWQRKVRGLWRPMDNRWPIPPCSGAEALPKAPAAAGEHHWFRVSGGPWGCMTPGCTVRKRADGMAWQPRKGARWYTCAPLAGTPIPPCAGGAVPVVDAQPSGWLTCGAWVRAHWIVNGNAACGVSHHGRRLVSAAAAQERCQCCLDHEAAAASSVPPAPNPPAASESSPPERMTDGELADAVNLAQQWWTPEHVGVRLAREAQRTRAAEAQLREALAQQKEMHRRDREALLASNSALLDALEQQVHGLAALLNVAAPARDRDGNGCWCWGPAAENENAHTLVCRENRSRLRVAGVIP